MNEEYLIFGTTSYLGSRVLNDLNDKKKKVRVFDGDYESDDDFKTFFKAQKSIIKYVINIGVNNEKINTALLNYGCDKYVYVSINDEDETYKSNLQKIDDSLNYSIINICAIYGAGDNNLESYINYKFYHTYFKNMNSYYDSTISLVNIKTAVKAVYHCALYGKVKSVYNLNGECYNTKELFTKFCKLIERKNLKYYDLDKLISRNQIFNLTNTKKEKGLILQKERKNLIELDEDNDQILKELDFKLSNIDDGLADLVKFLKSVS